MYEMRIGHEGLKAYRVVRGWTKQDVELAARCQEALWWERWERLQMAAEKRAERTRRVELREEAIWEALERTKAIQRELERLDNLLETVIAKDYRRDWESLKRGEPFEVPPPARPDHAERAKGHPCAQT